MHPSEAVHELQTYPISPMQIVYLLWVPVCWFTRGPADWLVTQHYFCGIYKGRAAELHGIIQGKAGDIQSKMKGDWKEAVIANWKLWIPFQFLNFRFIPQNLQVQLASALLPCGYSGSRLPSGCAAV